MKKILILVCLGLLSAMPAGAQAQLPDLVVDKIELSTDRPQIGENVNVKVTFENIGATFAQNVHNYVVDPLYNPSDFEMTNVYEFEDPVSVDNPWQTGETKSVEIAGHFNKSGLTPITAIYDNSQAITEANEVNNSLTTYLSVQPAITWGQFKTADSSAVYWYSHGQRKRYAFPNENVYFSWFSDFSNITLLTAEEMASIPLGGNVRFKPTAKPVKFVSDNKVYAIDVGNTLRWIKTEELARQLFGDDWASQVADIPDTLFLDYKFGPDITSATDYDKHAIDLQVQIVEDVCFER